MRARSLVMLRSCTGCSFPTLGDSRMSTQDSGWIRSPSDGDLPGVKLTLKSTKDVCVFVRLTGCVGEYTTRLVCRSVKRNPPQKLKM